MKMKCGNTNDIIQKEVVIIGNGPSGIALSHMLSGNVPFQTSAFHPDEMLSMRLKPCLNKCLLGQDLGALATGLEGRSTNPISLLMDALLHPCADNGLDMEPLVQFRKAGVEIDHIVLGKGPPGGSWHKMDPYILTLSLGSWMGLPGLPFVSRDSGEKRAFACNVANYYVKYVKEMQLESNFCNNVVVVKVTKIGQNKHIEDNWVNKIKSQRVKLCVEPELEDNQNSCILSNAINYILSKKANRCCCARRRELIQDQRIMSVKSDKNFARPICCCCDSTNLCDNIRSNRRNSKNSYSLEQNNVPYNCDPEDWLIETYNVETGETVSYSCKYLILANGASDLPNKLDISKGKSDPDWIFHDLRSLELNLDQYLLNKTDIDPVLIIGAGLSAADAVIATRGRNVPVVHVFRNKSADLNRQLPENMYPEYHKVHQMMQDGGYSYPLYTAYPEFTPTAVNDDKTVVLTSKSGDTVKIRVSFMVVLIGSRPDLNFLPADLNLGVRKNLPIDCKTNTVDIDGLTHIVNGFDNLFAVGPLAGDNFVRFIPGGALAVVNELYKRKNYVV